MIQITNECNMELMARYPDNYFDLAIVDPPYGIDIVEKSTRLGKAETKWKSGGKFKEYKYSEWDKNIPTPEYYSELIRVSKDQIIWGWNFINANLPVTKCFLLWDKIGRDDRADGELAWTSFSKPAKVFRYSRADAYINDCDIKIHPTQKPVKLYEWILNKYAKEGNKILDTHLGSGSIAIACYNLGFELTACELDKEYYNDALKRIKQHQEKAEEIKNLGYAKSELEKINPILF